MPVIGILHNLTVASESTRLAAVRQGLKENGFVKGQNVAIDNRYAQGDDTRLSALAADLVGRAVAVFVANSTACALVAKRTTTAILIVFVTGGDPVELGLVASFNRPGGNATGISFLINKLAAKRLEILSELASSANTVGILVDPNNPNAEADVRDAKGAATALGRTLLVLKASNGGEIDAAFAALAEQRVFALFVAANIYFVSRRDQIVKLAAQNGVAASFSGRDFVAAGGLMSYGPDPTDVYRQAGVYVSQILRGSRPADMLVTQPTKFEFVINLKTAKALGLDIPATLLARVDEVIE